MTWQPIETAPRDGTVIDLWFAGDWDCRMPDCDWCEPLGAWFARRRTVTYLDSPLITHWRPLPDPPAAQCDTAAFLSRMRAAAETGERVTADDVARLRRLADWADAPPAPGWNGTLDRGETMRAIDAAERRMRDE